MYVLVIYFPCNYSFAIAVRFIGDMFFIHLPLFLDKFLYILTHSLRQCHKTGNRKQDKTPDYLKDFVLSKYVL
ncbi:hypothetical protein NBRC111894_1139 [Sporolactobacillus inulinus]|uniref:Uncharacterized protein n=1 Tax=Sporolactobacillus inulinus TaxID=2078 RepID=A0A4Y1Z9A1_9BACL|nr:hypothetical protein NBRC111894_1139 [Sporolactobacillus inulinus]